MRSKNKLLITMLVILVSITLVGVIVLVVSDQLAEGGEKEEVRLSAAEIVEAANDVHTSGQRCRLVRQHATATRQPCQALPETGGTNQPGNNEPIPGCLQ